jgi:serine/threonine protein kinase
VQRITHRPPSARDTIPAVSAAPIPEPGSQVAGKYVLESVIGTGGMGTVFRARHLLSDRKVALKWMLPGESAGEEGIARFLREARAMGRIEHSSVVGVFDVGIEDGAAFLVMELLRGRALRALLEGGARIPPAEAIALLVPAMEGVAAAHAARVVHRDLKPENLFVVSEADGTRGTTKVLDFGVSKLRDDATSTPAVGDGLVTRTGTMVGTPGYMAPEQVRGLRDLDARTDVWALGVILYEMLTGEMPFANETLGQTLIAIATEPPIPIESVAKDLPPGLAGVVHRALEKAPDDRYPDVESFARALEPFSPGTRFKRPPPHSIPPPSDETPLTEATPSPTSPKRATGLATRVAGEPVAREASASRSGIAAKSLDLHVSIAEAERARDADATPMPTTTAIARAALHPERAWTIPALVLLGVVGVSTALFFGRGEGASAGDAAPEPGEPLQLALTDAASALDAGGVAVAVEEIAPAPSTEEIVEAVPPAIEPTTIAARRRPRPPTSEVAPPTLEPPPPVATPAEPGRTGVLSREEF